MPNYSRQVGCPIYKTRYRQRDEFSDVRAAGAVNGTVASPGPGTRAVVDTDGDGLSIGSSVLSLSNSNNDYDDPSISYVSLSAARVAGRVLIARAFTTTIAINLRIGWDNNQAGNIDEGSIHLGSLGDLWMRSDVNMALGMYSSDIWYSIAIVHRALGQFAFIKGGAFTEWTLLGINGTEGTTPIYPRVGMYSSAGGTQSVDSIRIPDILWTPTPLVSDSFDRSNGAIGTSDGAGCEKAAASTPAWESGGATWTIAGNEAINAPAEGAEKLTDGGLEAWTNPTNLTNWAEFAAGTSTINQDAAVFHGGANAARLDIDALSSAAEIYQAITNSTGDWLCIDWWGRASAPGALGWTKLLGGAPPPAAERRDPGAAWGEFVTVIRATAANHSVEFVATSASASFYFDDLSVKVLTLNTLFANLDDSATADVLATVELDAVVAGTQAGLVLNLDDKDTPANFIIAYHDGTNAKLEKCVAGTYTSVISAAAAYAAGAELRVWKSGTAYRLYYNNALVGAAVIADPGIVDNTKHGLFSTYSGNQFDNFYTFPTGTEPWYSGLGRY